MASHHRKLQSSGSRQQHLMGMSGYPTTNQSSTASMQDHQLGHYRVPPAIPAEPAYNIPGPPPSYSSSHALPPPLIMPHNALWPSMLNSQSNHQQPLLPAAPIQTPVSVTMPYTLSDTTLTSTKSTISRRRLTDDERRQMCFEAQQNPGIKQTQLGAKFNVDRSTVSKILRQKDKYLNAAPEEGSTGPMKKSKVKFPDIERALVNWVRNEQKKGVVITDEKLKKQAGFFATTSPGSESQQQVTPSAWLENFKKNLVNSGPLKGKAIFSTSTDDIIIFEELLYSPTAEDSDSLVQTLPAMTLSHSPSLSFDADLFSGRSGSTPGMSPASSVTSSSSRELEKDEGSLSSRVAERLVQGWLEMSGTISLHHGQTWKSHGTQDCRRNSTNRSQNADNLGTALKRAPLAKRSLRSSEKSDEERSEKKPKRPRQSAEVSRMQDLNIRLLKCPYNAFDAHRYSEQNLLEKEYRGCASCFISNIPRLKQHLYRVHQRPQNYCERCYTVFPTRAELDVHHRVETCFLSESPSFDEKMTDNQLKSIRQRDPGKTITEKWMQIFRELFPDSLVPASPYIEEERGQHVQDFLGYFLREAPRVIESELLRERKTPPADPSRSTMERALEKAIFQILWRFSSQMPVATRLGRLFQDDIDESLVDLEHSRPNSQAALPSSTSCEKHINERGRKDGSKIATSSSPFFLARKFEAHQEFEQPRTDQVVMESTLRAPTNFTCVSENYPALSAENIGVQSAENIGVQSAYVDSEYCRSRISAPAFNHTADLFESMYSCLPDHSDGVDSSNCFYALPDEGEGAEKSADQVTMNNWDLILGSSDFSGNLELDSLHMEGGSYEI